MLENIHDIAPGSPLAFATGAIGQVSFVAGSRAWRMPVRRSSSTTWVSGRALLPGRQVSQAINSFVANGGIYVSAASNQGDSGYMSEFRGVDATVTGIGSGRFQNFDGTGQTVATTLGVNLYQAGSAFIFQYDQPFDLPGGGGVSSDLDFYLLDASGNVVGSSLSNNVATNQPIEAILTDTSGNRLAAGLYQLAVQVVSGPDPGHIVIYEPGNGGFTVTAIRIGGRDILPGHLWPQLGREHDQRGRGPLLGAQPFTNPSTITNEPFSSTGPALIPSIRTARLTPPSSCSSPTSRPRMAGTPASSRRAANQHDEAPFPTAFFPPYPGQPQVLTGSPVTATDLDPDTLPNFFGTSSASRISRRCSP